MKKIHSKSLRTFFYGSALSVVLGAASHAFAAPNPVLDSAGWNILNQNNFRFNGSVSDEFNQPGNYQTPNTGKWNRYHPTGWKGNGKFTYSNGLAYTHQGNLILEARNGSYKGAKHSTGIVSSKQKFKHGYFEVRAQASTNLIASSFWFFDRGSRAGHSYEIDVFEHFPYKPWGNHRAMKSNIHHFVYTAATGNVDKIDAKASHAVLDNGGVVTGWHTYGVMREPGGLHFYVDGKRVHTLWRSAYAEINWPGNKPMRAILDILVYDWQNGPLAPAEQRSYYFVDYFRAWN